MTIHYPFKTEPYAHQLEALERSWQSREYALFMEMGTGKSKVLIDNVAMLYDNGEIDALLLIAPKGVYRNWSDKEIVDHMPDHISTRMAVWSTNLTKKKKAEINHLFEPNSDLCILVINVDALITPKGKKVLETFLNTRIALFCIDESTIIKNPKAKRTKAAVKLAKRAKYRRILTGSPVTKSPLDVYSQCEFLNDNLLGYSSYYGFRNRYAVTEDMHMAGRRIKQVVGYKNVDELQAILKDFSYRVTKAECLDLPEKVYMRREFDMTKEQKKAYLEMKDLAISFFEEGAASVTAVITQLLRLHQISCGHLPLDDGTLIEFPNRRIQHLEEVLEESDGKTIIWANYRNDIKHVKEFLVRTYGAHCFVTYYGDTSVEERKEAIEKFQNPESPVRFFVGNTQTGGYGITLTEASNVVYYSNNYDLEKRLQSEAVRLKQLYIRTWCAVTLLMTRLLKLCETKSQLRMP